jgi:hypothetical protein
MREKDEIDLQLDSALSTYADPGAHSGLEDRVVAALRAARTAENSPTPRRWRWLPWAIAIPIAASLLLLWFSTLKARHLPASQEQQARETRPATIPTRTSPSTAVRTHASARVKRPMHRAQAPSAVEVSKSIPRPKLDVFPTPQPLTAEERALVLVVTETPLPAREALVEAERLDAVPVRIAEIQIPPLEPPAQGQP